MSDVGPRDVMFNVFPRFSSHFAPCQVVKLKDVFPHGTGFVLVFDYMLSDLSEVIRNAQTPLTPAQVKGYMLMLLKGVAFLHHNNIMHRVRITHQVSLQE